MAASITGVFTIIDRASGPMRKMEAQAIKTMAAIEGAGKASDRMAGGSNKGAAALQKEDTNLKNVERSAKRAEQAVGGLDRSNRRSSDGTNRLSTSLIRLSGVMGFFGRAITALKIPGLAVGLSALAQAIGTAAGGLVALVPNIVTAAGAIGALPQILAAAAQGFGGLMVALGGVSQALQAGISMQQQSGLNAMQMANQHRQSAEAIRAASNGVMQAQLGVRNSEWALTDAQNQQMMAQRALTDARIEAVRQMQDMRLAEEGAVLGQKRAALQLREAQFTLAQSALDPTQTALDMQSNQLSVQEARLNAHQQRVNRVRSTQDLALAQRRGGARGSTGFIQAQQGVVQSNHALIQSNDAVRQSMFDVRSAQLSMRDALIQQRQQTRLGTSSQQQFNLAMKNLSPEAKHFVRYMMDLRTNLLQVRAAAGERLFPALETGFNHLLKLQPVVQDTLRQTGGVIGNMFDRIARSMTTAQRISDFRKLGASNNRLLAMFGRALNNVGQGLTDLMMAARPFTHWLAKTVLGWTQMWRQSMAAGRATGDLRDKFDRVRTVLEQFGRIVENVWHTLVDLADAATPLGNKLWDGAEKATQGWQDFMDSAKGAKEARQWFNDLYAPLHQLGQLASELAVAWAKLTVSGGFTETVKTLRGAVPYLLKFMQGTAGLGPQVAQLLTQIVRLMSDIPFGPLQVFLNVLNKIVSAFDWLLENVPGLATVFAAVLTVSGLSRFATKLGSVVSGWLGVKRAAEAAGVAQAVASAGGGSVMLPTGFSARGSGVVGGTVARDAEGALIPIGAGAMSARPGVLGNIRATFAAGRDVGMSRLGALGVAARAGGATALSTAGAIGSKVVFPVTAALGAMGAINTQIDPNSGILPRTGRVLQGVASGATLGLIHAPASTTDRFNTGLGEGQDFLANGARYVAVQKQIRDLKRQSGSADMFDLAQINGQLEALKQGRSQLAGQRTTNMINQFFGGQDPATAFGQMLDAAKRGGGGIVTQMGTVQKQVGRELGKIPRSGRQQFIDLYQAWLDQQAKNHPKIAKHEHDLLVNLADRYGKLGKNVKIVNGHILTASDAMWSKLAAKAKTGSEKVKEKTKEGLTGVQHQIKAILMMQTGSSMMAGLLVRQIEAGNLTMNQARHFGQGTLPGPITSRDLTPQMRHFAGIPDPHHRRKPPPTRPGIPRASGGPVDPTNTFLVGEAGPELFVPHAHGHIIPNQNIGDASQLMSMKHQGELILDDTGRSWRKKMSDTRVGIGKEMDNLRKNANDNWDGIDKQGSNSADHMRKFVTDASDRMSGQTSNDWTKLRQNVHDDNDAMVTSTQNGFQRIEDEMRKALTGLGYKGSQVDQAMRGQSIGGGGKSGGGSSKKAATGGRLGGVGLHDTVSVGPGMKAAPGELIVNRHTEGRVNQMLGGRTTLGNEVARESTPHYANPRDSALKNYRQARAMGRAFATGGTMTMVDPAWDPGTERLNSLISATVGAWARKYHADMTAGYDPGDSHVSPGHNVTGTATDMVPLGGWTPQGTSLFEKGLAAVVGQVDQVIYGPQWVPGTMALENHGRGNHAHIEWGMHPNVSIKGGALPVGIGQKIPQLKRVMGYGGPGAVRRGASQGALDNVLAAAQKRLGGSGKTPVVHGGSVPAQIASVLLAHGLDRIGAAGIIGNAYAESTWNPAATGYGGGGLWGFTASPNSLADLQAYAQGQGTPWTNVGTQTEFLLKHVAGSTLAHLNAASSAAQSATIFMNEFERPGIPRLDVRIAGAQKALKMFTHGGRTPDWGGWNASGFDGVVRRPTVFGAGEGGVPEHVSISPAGGATTAKGPGGGAGGGGGINVRIDKIEWKREGDVQEAIQREMALLAEDINYTGNEN